MTHITIPPPLKPGDTIGIAAPAASFNHEKLDKGISVIKDLGFNVFIPDNMYARKRYLAGNDQDRAKQLESLIWRDDIQAIICARGGFGSLRILPFLTPSIVNASPKRLIGFSDISPLLNFFAFNYRWVTFHGPVVIMLADADNHTIESLYHALTTISPKYIPTPEALQIISNGNAKIVSGQLWGGNLTSLCHTIGTPYSVDFSEGILFLEDRGEATYRIDRMLTQMRLSGYFDNVKAVLLGNFKDCGDMAFIHELLLECFDSSIPIISGYNCGHDLPNYTFPLGLRSELHTDDGTVRFLNSHYNS